jgi:glycosyltransferase involved in cell wall biosynthesis
MMINLLLQAHLRNFVNFTGTGRVASNIIKSVLAADDFDTRILGDADDYTRFDLGNSPEWRDCEFLLFSGGTRLRQAAWVLLERPRAESYWPQVDVVYTTGETYVPSKGSAEMALIHDVAYFEAGAHQKNRYSALQRAKMYLLLKRLEQRVDVVHTVSHFSAERLEYFFPKLRGRIKVIHNGVSDFFSKGLSAGDRENLKTLGLLDRRFVFLPRGLQYRKCADIVVDVWPKIARSEPDLQLVVTSNCEAHYAECLAAESSVKILGYVSDEILRTLYRAALVTWFPTRYEGFGLPLLESMACGCPVLASNTSAVPEVAGKCARLVDNERNEDHFEGILELCGDHDLREDLSRLGLEWVKNFELEQKTNEVLVTLRELGSGSAIGQ